MQPGDQKQTHRRLRLLLVATVGALLIGDVAGAQRAAGLSGAARARAASSTRASAGVVRLTAASGTLHAGREDPTTTIAITIARPAPSSRPAPPSSPEPPPTPASTTSRPTPPPTARPAAPTAPPTTRPPTARPTAPTPAPVPKPAPAPRPAPAPDPAPRPLTTPPDPAASVPPDQAFQQACWTPSPDPQACNQAALTDIDNARSREGLGPLTLPAGFAGLPAAAQLVAVANAERTSRGLPAMPENAGLDADARQGAEAGRDPSGPAGYTWDSNWALGDPTALAADYSWMYDDGRGSQNIDCTSTDTSGCWGHRHNILSPWAGSAGGGVSTYEGRTSLAELFVKSP